MVGLQILGNVALAVVRGSVVGICVGLAEWMLAARAALLSLLTSTVV